VKRVILKIIVLVLSTLVPTSQIYAERSNQVGIRSPIVNIPESSTLDAPVYIYVLRACSFDAETAKSFQRMRILYPNMSKEVHEGMAIEQIKKENIDALHTENLFHVFNYVWNKYSKNETPSMVWKKTYTTCRKRSEAWWKMNKTIPPLNQFIYPKGFRCESEV